LHALNLHTFVFNQNSHVWSKSAHLFEVLPRFNYIFVSKPSQY